MIETEEHEYTLKGTIILTIVIILIVAAALSPLTAILILDLVNP